MADKESQTNSQGQQDVTTAHLQHSQGQQDATTAHLQHSQGQQDATTAHLQHSQGQQDVTTAHLQHSQGQQDVTTAHLQHSQGQQDVTTAHLQHSQGQQDVTTAHLQHSQGQQDVTTAHLQHSQGQQDVTTAHLQHSQGQQGVTTAHLQHSQGQQGVTTAHLQHSQGQQGVTTAHLQHSQGQQDVTTAHLQHSQGQQGVTTAHLQHSQGQQDATTAHLQHSQDGIIYKGDQIVVPLSLRADYLSRLHASHMGCESTLHTAREVMYWPNMAADIQRVTRECRVCEQDSPAQGKEKHLAHKVPKQPWDKVGVDLWRCKGKDYLVMVDYLTRGPCLKIPSFKLIESMFMSSMHACTCAGHKHMVIHPFKEQLMQSMWYQMSRPPPMSGEMLLIRERYHSSIKQRSKLSYPHEQMACRTAYVTPVQTAFRSLNYNLWQHYYT